MSEVVGGSPVRLLAALRAICDHWSTHDQSERLDGTLASGGQWLTLGEAIERLQGEPHPVPISYSTLRRMAERREIPTMRVGARRDRRVPVDAVDALKERLWAEAYPADPSIDAGQGDTAE